MTTESRNEPLTGAAGTFQHNGGSSSGGGRYGSADGSNCSGCGDCNSTNNATDSSSDANGSGGKDHDVVVLTQRSKELPVVDTTGAGDAFAAGFVYTWKVSLNDCYSLRLSDSVHVAHNVVFGASRVA